LAGVAAALCPPHAAVAGAGTTVTPARVAAGIFFDGATLVVRGTIDEHSQVVIRVVGPAEEQTYNRRGKIGGLIWGGVEHVTFLHAPSVYAVYTTAALRAIAEPDVRRELMLGYEALNERVTLAGNRPDAVALVEQLVKLKEREGLYRIHLGGVQVEDARTARRRFHAEIPLPAAVPPGLLDVTTFEFSGGRVVASEAATVEVTRVGLPAQLYTLAHVHGFLFGLLAVVVSIAAGLGIGLVANPRRRRRVSRSTAGALAGEPPPDDGSPEPAGARAVLRIVRQALSPHPFGPPPSQDLDLLRTRYRVFRDLLRVNSEVLDLLAELEEESSWTSFARPRVRTQIRALFDGTWDMVTLLNDLSGDRYFDLLNVVTGIRRDVMEFFSKVEDEDSPRLVLQLREVTSANASRVGGKALNLARLECDLGVRVPESFVVTTDAYRLFLEQGDLAGKLRAVLAPARLDQPDDFRRRCELAQALVDETEVPPAVVEAIRQAWTLSGIPEAEGAAVRSSAAGEDSELSFAGQFETVLNAPLGGLGEAWRRVVRSRFAARAVFYRRAGGLAEVDTPMGVLVQRMIRSRASGVIFTRRPDDPKASVLLLASVLGLGPDASAGTADADELVVSRREPRRVLQRRIARKAQRLVCGPAGSLEREQVEAEAQVLAAVSDPEVLELAERALSIEQYFGRPQDIEWTVGDDGRVVILQARPLQTTTAEEARQPVPPDAPLLLRGGHPVWSGRAVGTVFVAPTPADEDRVPPGSILVVSQLLPDCVRFLPLISGLVVEHGTVTGHAASIVREFRVPSLFGLEGATRTLVSGQTVSLDTPGRSVYAGALWPNLQAQPPLSVVGRQAIGLPRVLASKLTRLSGSAFVSSWACQSLHDVIRYAHEMAILAMFDIGDGLLELGSGVKRVECPPSVYLHLVDLGGGLAPGAAAKRTIRCDEVVSVPFRALWRGLVIDEVPRPPVDGLQARSIASMLVNTVTSTGARRLGVPNYACVTDTYMNLNSRQAYHYAVVDAVLSENQNNNHVSVRMKGGGAAAWQRNLRARFMCEVLRLHRFTATATGDVLTAWCRGVDQATGAEMLAHTGRLLRFSAQLDVLMDSESQVQTFVESFVELEKALALRGTTEGTAAGGDAAGARPER
jgi:pyruvate,water dikinase